MQSRYKIFLSLLISRLFQDSTDIKQDNVSTFISIYTILNINLFFTGIVLSDLIVIYMSPLQYCFVWPYCDIYVASPVLLCLTLLWYICHLSSIVVSHLIVIYMLPLQYCCVSPYCDIYVASPVLLFLTLLWYICRLSSIVVSDLIVIYMSPLQYCCVSPYCDIYVASPVLFCLTLLWYIYVASLLWYLTFSTLLYLDFLAISVVGNPTPKGDNSLTTNYNCTYI
jgi:hypothetical protein